MDSAKKSRPRLSRPAGRRLVQLYSALLYNAHIKGFIEGEIYRGPTKYACVPGLNCYSCPGAVGACPLGALQNALSASGHRAGWYVLGILLLYGVILGRTVCGWLCPVGLIQELLYRLPTPKLRKSPVTRALTWVKYGILAIFAVAIPLWYGLKRGLALPAFCKYICPAGTLEGGVGLLSNPVNTPKLGMLGLLFTRKFVVMLLIGLTCVFVYRAFCRFICPLGAIYSLFNRFNVVGVKVNSERCNRCGACARHCGMDVRHVGDRECIHCAGCMAVCAQGAISLKAGSITLKEPAAQSDGRPDTSTNRRRASRVFQGIALTILGLALLCYNLPNRSQRKASVAEPTTAAQSASSFGTSAATQVTSASNDLAAKSTASPTARGFDSDAPVGFQIGQQLADFTVDCYDGTQFRLADERGKITFINLWATYCAPCVRELPYFDDLYARHADDLAILAVHSSLVTDDPEEYLAGKGYSLSFATDSDDDRIFKIVNGSATLPQTIVLNRRGEVVYNQVGSVTPELLDALYREADQ